MEQLTKSPTKTAALDVVLAFIKGLNDEDFKAARECVADDMIFEGVLGTRNGAEAYFNDMERMKLKYEIKMSFQNGNDVALMYNIEMSGENIFCAGWYKVKDGKIKSMKVVFDPRPLLGGR